MLSYLNRNKINFLRICIQTIQDTHVILIISAVLSTGLGKVALLNKRTYNSFQGSDLRLKGLWGLGGWGITTKIILKPWEVLHQKPQRVLLMLTYISLFDKRKRMTTRGRRFSENWWHKWRPGSLRPRSSRLELGGTTRISFRYYSLEPHLLSETRASFLLSVCSSVLYMKQILHTYLLPERPPFCATGGDWMVLGRTRYLYT